MLFQSDSGLIREFIKIPVSQSGCKGSDRALGSMPKTAISTQYNFLMLYKMFRSSGVLRERLLCTSVTLSASYSDH